MSLFFCQLFSHFILVSNLNFVKKKKRVEVRTGLGGLRADGVGGPEGRVSRAGRVSGAAAALAGPLFKAKST